MPHAAMEVMMYCQVCGNEDAVRFRKRSCLVLCAQCHKTTPKKVSRKKFDKLYWGRDFDTVDESTRQSFYNDYCISMHRSVEEYVRTTREVAS